jgi:hypothetical protein
MTKNQRERLKLEADIKAYLKDGGKVKQLQWGETADDEKKRLARTRRISINGNEPFVR